MLDLHDSKQAYEIFRLQWMIDHGYGILDLIKNLVAMIEEDQIESGVRTSLESLFKDWEFGIGFMAPSGHAMRNSWSMTIL